MIGLEIICETVSSMFAIMIAAQVSVYKKYCVPQGSILGPLRIVSHLCE